MNSSKLSGLIRKIYPIWNKGHSFYIPKENNLPYLSIKSFMESESFIDTFEIQKKYTSRDIIYILLNSLNTDLPEDVHKDIDELFTEEKAKIKTFKISDFSKRKVILWKGDITNLEVDAIVNAANSFMLGCFIPFHRCIDNVIHDKAGPRLREECRSWKIKNQPPGKCIISKGYHLPAKNIFHIVGPIYNSSIDQSLLLKSCYTECLDKGKIHSLSSIAFCCISTGIFGYPNKEAAIIACKGVRDWLIANEGNHSFNHIVYNVFKEDDYEIYKEIGPNIFLDDFEIL